LLSMFVSVASTSATTRMGRTDDRTRPQASFHPVWSPGTVVLSQCRPADQQVQFAAGNGDLLHHDRLLKQKRFSPTVQRWRQHHSYAPDRTAGACGARLVLSNRASASRSTGHDPGLEPKRRAARAIQWCASPLTRASPITWKPVLLTCLTTLTLGPLWSFPS
jgi:hypothetical protein